VLLGSSTFDVRSVEANAVRFAGASAVQFSLCDVNHDGFLDLALNFRTQDTVLGWLYAQLLADDVNADGILDSTYQSAQVKLTGRTIDGTEFAGIDHLDLFLSGKALRDLLDRLAAEGAL